jgi:hypothetical protein
VRRPKPTSAATGAHFLNDITASLQNLVQPIQRRITNRTGALAGEQKLP